MRTRFLLPALWLLMLMLPMPRLRAQGRLLGPWQVVVKKVRVRVGAEDDWGPAAKDTATYLKSEATAVPVRWDIAPDSIRLFLNCANPLLALQQPHKEQQLIRFSAGGATIQQDTKNQRLLIIPSATVVTLWAYRGQALIFKHIFKVIAPPVPTIQCFYSNFQPTDLKPGEGWEGRLNLRAVPSPYFSLFMPDDARCRVSLSQVSILRDNDNILLKPIRIVKGPNADIGGIDNFQPGDKLQIEVQQVQRQNFRGVVEDIPLTKHFVVKLR